MIKRLIVTLPWLFTLFFRKDIKAFAFWPFIVLRDQALKHDERLLRHERIHHKQQTELLFILFYLIYCIEFFVRWVKLQETDKAYRAISFEREAFRNDHDPDYVKHRKIWQMWRL